ncbi:unnamed protein product [Rotaria sordida]|uniref:NHL repeat-containing protein n=1 Tax=Rotaria sordida TaxID=392033 RepID=A0A816FP55_9BILA|nr:unnamed protein product [Rotaria sordida]CAF1663830.1 unnamed protein product [Rotaria sordida]
MIIVIFGYGIASRAMIAYGTFDFDGRQFFRNVIYPVYYFMLGSFDNEVESFEGKICIDQLGTVYVADTSNHRIIRWPKGATQGSVIVGGNGAGRQSNQLTSPVGLSFDRHGNLYVVDYENDRVQKFNIEQTAN